MSARQMTTEVTNYVCKGLFAFWLNKIYMQMKFFELWGQLVMEKSKTENWCSRKMDLSFLNKSEQVLPGLPKAASLQAACAVIPIWAQDNSTSCTFHPPEALPCLCWHTGVGGHSLVTSVLPILLQFAALSPSAKLFSSFSGIQPLPISCYPPTWAAPHAVCLVSLPEPVSCTSKHVRFP